MPLRREVNPGPTCQWTVPAAAAAAACGCQAVPSSRLLSPPLVGSSQTADDAAACLSERTHGHGHGRPAAAHGCLRSPLPAPPPLLLPPAYGRRLCLLLFTAPAPPPARRLPARRSWYRDWDGDRDRGRGGAQGRGVRVQAALLRRARHWRRALPRLRHRRRQDPARDRVPVSSPHSLRLLEFLPPFLHYLLTVRSFPCCFMPSSWPGRLICFCIVTICVIYIYHQGLCQAAYLLTRYIYLLISLCPCITLSFFLE